MRRVHEVTALAIAAALVVVACGGGDDTTTEQTDPTSTTAVDTAPTTVPDTVSPPDPDTAATTTTATTFTTEPPAAPPLDLDDDPFLFFAPISERPPNRRDFPTPDGSSDYFELFQDDADWQTGLAELDAFKIHFWQIRHYLADNALVNIGDFLDRHGIPLMIEAEPLDPPDPDECNHTESFEGPYELEQAQRLADLGIEVAAIAIEQPYHFAHKLEGPGACRYELDRVVDEVVTWVADMREIFPDVAVGSIEGFWVDPPTSADDYARWLDSYEAAAGEPFAFQHIDIDWARPDWIDAVLEIEEVVEARDVPFGVLFNGGAQATTSDEWIRLAAEHHADYLRAGGSPAHIGFQSWQDLPDRVLPESDPHAFTNLLVRAFGDDARFESGPVLDPSGGVSGRLVGTDGGPLAGRTVSAEIVPRGAVRTTVVTEHVVPSGTTETLVAVRVNSEDARRGATDTLLHSIAVTTSDGAQLVPNGDFERGLDAWGVYDDNTGTTSAVGTGDGAALRLQADDGQVINIDGSRFAAPAGDTVTVSVDAEFPAVGGAPDIVVIHFAGAAESARSTTPLRVDASTLGSAVTDTDGHFVVPVDGSPVGEYRVSVTTADDPQTWPTTATADVVLG